MQPTIEELDTLIHIVACGSITAAADRLRTTKSVVSKRLSHLEMVLGTDLFSRSGRKMVPTDLGLRVYERARGVTVQIDALMEEVASASSSLQGTTRVAGPLSFGTRFLGPIVAEFMLLHPQIHVVLDLDDRFVDLRSGDYDFAVRIGRLEDSALKARKLATSWRGVYASPDYLRRSGLPKHPTDLTEHACLSYANAASAYIWHFEPTAGGTPLALSLPARLVSNSGEALCEAAAAGLGLAALPAFIARDAVQAGKLTEVSMPGWCMTNDPINAVYPDRIAQPVKVRTLIDFIAARLKAFEAEAMFRTRSA